MYKARMPPWNVCFRDEDQNQTDMSAGSRAGDHQNIVGQEQQEESLARRGDVDE